MQQGNCPRSLASKLIGKDYYESRKTIKQAMSPGEIDQSRNLQYEQQLSCSKCSNDSDLYTYVFANPQQQIKTQTIMLNQGQIRNQQTNRHEQDIDIKSQKSQKSLIDDLIQLSDDYQFPASLIDTLTTLIKPNMRNNEKCLPNIASTNWREESSKYSQICQKYLLYQSKSNNNLSIDQSAYDLSKLSCFQKVAQQTQKSLEVVRQKNISKQISNQEITQVQKEPSKKQQNKNRIHKIYKKIQSTEKNKSSSKYMKKLKKQFQNSINILDKRITNESQIQYRWKLGSLTIWKTFKQSLLHNFNLYICQSSKQSNLIIHYDLWSYITNINQIMKKGFENIYSNKFMSFKSTKTKEMKKLKKENDEILKIMMVFRDVLIEKLTVFNRINNLSVIVYDSDNQIIQIDQSESEDDEVKPQPIMRIKKRQY